MPPHLHPRRQTLLVAATSAAACTLLAGFIAGGLYGLGLDFQGRPAASDLGPRLAGELLDGIRFGVQSRVDCTHSAWRNYLSPDFDRVPELVAQPLTIQVNASDAPGLDWTFIQEKAASVFGVTLDVGGYGLPVLLLKHPTGVDASTGGRLNHDQLYVQGRDGHLLYRGHTLYQIELFPSGEEELLFLHELGHSLGLGHIDRDGQIMAHRTDRMAFRIHECHADWLQHLAPTIWRHQWP